MHEKRNLSNLIYIIYSYGLPCWNNVYLHSLTSLTGERTEDFSTLFLSLEAFVSHAFNADFVGAIVSVTILMKATG